jgi:hypothetical protein
MCPTRPHTPAGRQLASAAAAAGMLAACLALAAWVVSVRGLADPVRVPGWRITFQPPKGWDSVNGGGEPGTDELRYRQTTAGGRTRELIVARQPNPWNEPASQVCLLEAAALLGIRHLAALAGQVEAAPFGPLPGARVIARPGPLGPGFYLHVGTWDVSRGDGDAYVISLVPPDVTLGEALAKAVRLSDG